MLASDQLKLCKAGFTILRQSHTITYPNGTDKKRVAENISIRYKDSAHHEWCILEKGFPSLAACRRRMDELLRDNKTVEE